MCFQERHSLDLIKSDDRSTKLAFNTVSSTFLHRKKKKKRLDFVPHHFHCKAFRKSSIHDQYKKPTGFIWVLHFCFKTELKNCPLILKTILGGFCWLQVMLNKEVSPHFHLSSFLGLNLKPRINVCTIAWYCCRSMLARTNKQLHNLHMASVSLHFQSTQPCSICRKYFPLSPFFYHIEL